MPNVTLLSDEKEQLPLGSSANAERLKQSEKKVTAVSEIFFIYG
jgi:hypothetical protein